jgi:hypothetical protein
MLGSYVVALGVVNVLIEQRRKNLKTIQSDLRDEMLYLVGLRDEDESDGPSSLREIIVAQIRREALYRRIVKDEAAGRTPEVAIPPNATSAARAVDESLGDGQVPPARDRSDGPSV